MKETCRLSSVVCLMSVLVAPAFAAGEARQSFACDMKTYVPFDATTVVTVECPDDAAAKWAGDHFAESADCTTFVTGAATAAKPARQKANAATRALEHEMC